MRLHLDCWGRRCRGRDEGLRSEWAARGIRAKVAVADDEVCFITSANLTGHAMEQNMEVGVLISGDGVSKGL